MNMTKDLSFKIVSFISQIGKTILAIIIYKTRLIFTGARNVTWINRQAIKQYALKSL